MSSGHDSVVDRPGFRKSHCDMMMATRDSVWGSTGVSTSENCSCATLLNVHDSQNGSLEFEKIKTSGVGLLSKKIYLDVYMRH